MPRATLPGDKPITMAMATKLVIGAIALAGIVWGAASLIGGKAEASDLRAVEHRVHEIDTDVQIIKSEQRMLIRAIRPDLPVGKD